MKLKYILFLLLILTVINFAQENRWPPANLQAKTTTLNNVSVTISNWNNSGSMLHSMHGRTKTITINYPAGSNQDMGEQLGIWFGAKVNDEVRVTVGADWEGENAGNRGYRGELYPRFNNKDTIYEASVFDDLPEDTDPNAFFTEQGNLHPKYKPLSPQDFICQMWDNKVTSGTPGVVSEIPTMIDHVPLNAYVIQRIYSYDFEIYKNIIFFDYYIVNEGNEDWKDFFFAVYADMHMGKNVNRIDMGDDLAMYDRDNNIMLNADGPKGGDGPPLNDAHVAYKIIDAPFDLNDPNITYSFRHWDKRNQPKNDEMQYRWMVDGEIDPDMDPDIPAGSATKSFVSVGPIKVVQPGDTLKFTYALACGNGKEEAIRNILNAVKLQKKGFAVPVSPSIPQYEAIGRKNAVYLDWNWKDLYSGINPEEFVDNSREDDNKVDFDGYRVYRSTNNQYGPWEIIAEFDKINGANNDFGLEHSFLDQGLVNGMKYYYTITSFDIPEFLNTGDTVPSLESPKSLAVKVGIPAISREDTKSDEVFVVPNPYDANQDYTQYPKWEYPTQPGRSEWFEIDRRIAFMNLPPECKITIFTLDGSKVNTIDFNQGSGSPVAFWNLLNINNHTVATGLYYFLVEEPNGKSQIGKFVIIK